MCNGVRGRQTASVKLSLIGTHNIREKKHFPRYAAALETLKFILGLVGALKDGDQKLVVFSGQLLGGIVQMETEAVMVKPFPERSTPARGGKGAQWAVGSE